MLRREREELGRTEHPMRPQSPYFYCDNSLSRWLIFIYLFFLFVYIIQFIRQTRNISQMLSSSGNKKLNYCGLKKQQFISPRMLGILFVVPAGVGSASPWGQEWCLGGFLGLWLRVKRWLLQLQASHSHLKEEEGREVQAIFFNQKSKSFSRNYLLRLTGQSYAI